jgi:hypothetical protein
MPGSSDGMKAKKSIPSYYKDYLLKNSAELKDKIREADVAFQKVMKNLVFGTNRSIFLTTIGKENEGTEKWKPGKPINRVNIRATVANFFPDNAIDSIYINTFRDERELSFYLLVDTSDALYPDTFDFGVANPFQVKAIYSVFVQALVKSLARDYDASLNVLYFPARDLTAAAVDTKLAGFDTLTRVLRSPDGAPGSPSAPFQFLFRKNVKHSVIVCVSHEDLFTGRDADFFKALSTFSLTNDIIFFPLCTNHGRLLSDSGGPVEVQVNEELMLVNNEKDRKLAASRIEAGRNAKFGALAESGIHVCPIACGEPDWLDSVIGFFRTRLVMR